MAIEIERKFLVKDQSWKKEVKEGTFIRQGYLNSATRRMVRVRVNKDRATLTIKGENKNLTRKEFEYEIPLKDGLSILDMCETPIIEKIRYLFKINQSNWEIDVFEGKNKGLVVAEIELGNEEEPFDKPSWLGKEVSFDHRYYNLSLVANPYSNW